MATEITRKNKRKPLKVSYDGKKYTLPGRIPTELVGAQNSVPRPKVMAGSQEEKYRQNVSVATIGAFLEFVVPEDFRAELDLEDVPEVFQVWSEYTGLGKSNGSDNSKSGTKRSSSTSADEADSE